MSRAEPGADGQQHATLHQIRVMREADRTLVLLNLQTAALAGAYCKLMIVMRVHSGSLGTAQPWHGERPPCAECAAQTILRPTLRSNATTPASAPACMHVHVHCVHAHAAMCMHAHGHREQRLQAREKGIELELPARPRIMQRGYTE